MHRSLVLVACLVLAGCALTRQIGTVEQSGFLGDYSQLRKGESDEAQMVYINSSTDFSKYDAIMIQSVALWMRGDEKLPDEEVKMLTGHLYQAIHEQLKQDYRIVDSPGQGVMRLKVALTQAGATKVVLNAITSILPPPRLLTTVAGVATDTQAVVGVARVEAEVTDSVSGERLLAAVDARAGTKNVRGGLGKWSDVKSAFDFWAERIRTRLAELRAS